MTFWQNVVPQWGPVLISAALLVLAFLKRKPEGKALNAQARQYEAQAEASTAQAASAREITDVQAKDLILRFGIAAGEDVIEMRQRLQALELDHKQLRNDYDGITTWARQYVRWAQALMAAAAQSDIVVTEPPPLPVAISEGV